jgi:hypothetical protein
MARMISLSPVPKVALSLSGWELLAPEAGRYAYGLRASVQLWNGTIQSATPVDFALDTSRQACILLFSTAVTIDEKELVKCLLALSIGVETALRDAEARQPPQRPSQATELVELADTADLFHAPDGSAYATIEVSGHYETYLIKAKGFRRWLARQFYLCSQHAPGSQALQDALGVLEGKALFEGPMRSIYTRLAEHDGAIYLDMADERWRAIKVGPDGWAVVDHPPVKFRRAAGMLPLPEPALGGDLDDLQAFLNIDLDKAEDWKLIVLWETAACCPAGPYIVVGFHGEHGNAKSTTARILRELIDPNEVALRADPRNTHDLVISAHNGWIINLDNLSRIPHWLSDALCRLSSGSGFATRELFSDSEEVLFNAQRPIILNGIEEVATREDLLDRSILIELPTIKNGDRKPEKRFWADFRKAHPQLLGAILSTVSGALKRLPNIDVAELPRMADFALWAVAVEQTLAWDEGSALQAYAQNRAAASKLGLDVSVIFAPLEEVIKFTDWDGTATDLLSQLKLHVSADILKQSDWPKNGKSLSDTLRRLAPNLRAEGIDVVFAPRTMKGRKIRVENRNRKAATP